MYVHILSHSYFSCCEASYLDTGMSLIFYLQIGCLYFGVAVLAGWTALIQVLLFYSPYSSCYHAPAFAKPSPLWSFYLIFILTCLIFLLQVGSFNFGADMQQDELLLSTFDVKPLPKLFYHSCYQLSISLSHETVILIATYISLSLLVSAC